MKVGVPQTMFANGTTKVHHSCECPKQHPPLPPVLWPQTTHGKHVCPISQLYMNQCRKRIYDIRQCQLIHLWIQNLFQYSKFKSKRATQEYIYFHVFTEERAQHLASTFGCIVGQLPFTYLGLPLGTTRPAVVDFLPLVCRIERRMAGISSLLSYHGRLILVNSLLSSPPMYWLSTIPKDRYQTNWQF